MHFEIPAKLPTWNSWYSGRHWTERVKLKDVWRALTLEALPEGVAMFEKPVHITVHAEFKRTPQDADNVCIKLVIDALKGRVLRDDNPNYLAGITVYSVKSDRDHVTFDIEEV